MADRRITITIPKKKKPKRSNGGSLHRGPIRTERKSEYLSRRRKAGGITFYDLGQFANGTSLTKSFTLEIIDGSIQPPETGQVTAAWDEIKSEIFAVPSIFTAFKKISKTDDVARSITLGIYDPDADTVNYVNMTECDEVAGSTLRLSQEQAENLDIQGDAAIFPLSLSIDNFKVTAARSPDADSVSFTPSQNMDVGIAPEFSDMAGSVNYPSGSPGLGLTEIIGGVYSTIPRNLAPVLNGFDYADLYDKWRMFRGLPGVRARRDSIGGTWSDIDVDAFAPPTYFPVPPAEPDPATTNAVAVIGGTSPFETDALLMVIRQNGNMFYFWQL